MSAMECKHRMGYDKPIDFGGDWAGRGLICRKCGVKTLTVSTYTPTRKDCPSCGEEFNGMPEDDGELCDDCIAINLDAFIKRISTCRHRNLNHGMCHDCGTGWHGRHQWRWRVREWIHDVRLRVGVG